MVYLIRHFLPHSHHRTSSFDGGRASCHQLEMNDISSETPPIHDVQPFTVAAPSIETPSTLTGASSDMPVVPSH